MDYMEEAITRAQAVITATLGSKESYLEAFSNKNKAAKHYENELKKEIKNQTKLVIKEFRQKEKDDRKMAEKKADKDAKKEEKMRKKDAKEAEKQRKRDLKTKKERIQASRSIVLLTTEADIEGRRGPVGAEQVYGCLSPQARWLPGHLCPHLGRCDGRIAFGQYHREALGTALWAVSFQQICITFLPDAAG